MDDEWRIDAVGPGEVSGSHLLVFAEYVAHFRGDLLAEAVEFLTTLPGVAGVERDDRTAIAIGAHAVPTWQLTEAVRRWWEAAKDQRRPWMIAMDRAAQTMCDLTVSDGYQPLGETPRNWDHPDGWELNRILDAELTHVINLNHEFGDEPGEHRVVVSAGVRLTLPDLEESIVWEYWYTGNLDDGVEFVSAITDQVLPTLDALPTVDALLDRWQRKRLPAQQFAPVLVSRGRLAEARQVCQQAFDQTLPNQRPYLLRFVERLGLLPLTTGANPHLSVAEEATLATWQANTGSMIDQLRGLTGVRLDGSRRSIDELWAWLRDSPDCLRAAFADATPLLASSYYGLRTNDIRSGRALFEPWYRVAVELVTAYLGEVVIGEAPATMWGINGERELALIRHGDSIGGLLWRAFDITREAFGAPVDEFDPRRLRRLADDMVRSVTHASKAIVPLGMPGT